MVKVVWTDSAIEDLNDIGNYIARDSERYAEITVNRLFDFVDILEQHPKSGKKVPDYNDDSIRELIIMIKRYKTRVSADVGLIFVAYNLRRLINILCANREESFCLVFFHKKRLIFHLFKLMKFSTTIVLTKIYSLINNVYSFVTGCYFDVFLVKFSF